MKQTLAFITILALLISGITAASYSTTTAIHKNPYANRFLLEQGAELPPLWLYYDTDDVNSRHWADFGARSSNALNIPFLNLCYGSIVSCNGKNYRVEIIGGIGGIEERLGSAALPPALHEPKRIGDAEYNWFRAAILEKFGGLWLDPSSICIKGFGELPKDRVVFFGTDKDQTYAGPRGTAVPSLNAIWVPQAGHPIMKAWADAAYRRIVEKNTGAMARQDAKWDYVAYAATAVEDGGAVVIPSAELSRNRRTGKRLQLEDLLATGQEGNLPFDVPGEAVYIPMPWKELRDRRVFGWFLRMSEAQIMASDIIIRDLLMLSGRI
jgi:hypothetical protein